MIDYDNTRFSLLFKMAPPYRWQEFEAITFAAVPEILTEMKTWHDSCNEAWGHHLDSGEVAAMMSVTSVYGPRGAEYVAEQPSDEAEEILAELENIVTSFGYGFDRNTPLIHNNAECHAAQIYFN